MVEGARPDTFLVRMTWITALISARWVNACGKLPRWRPVRGVELLGVQTSGLANDSSFSHS